MGVLDVGNIVKDWNKTKDREWQSFGGASFSAVTFAKLGYDTTVLCRGNVNDSEYRSWIAHLHNNYGINFVIQPGENTCFVNDYSSGSRKQRLLSHSGKISCDVGKLKDRYDCIHLNPLYQEVGLDLAKELRSRTKHYSADAQGFVRTVKNDQVSGRFWEEREEYLKLFDILKIGIDELPYVSKETDHRKVCRELHKLGVKVPTITLGEEGSISYHGKQFYKVGVYKTKVRSETGAGDVFISAFDVKFMETKNVWEAALFGTAAASTVLEGFGPDCIGDRILIESRYRMLKDAIKV